MELSSLDVFPEAHLVLPCTITSNCTDIKTYFLNDSGATDNFIDHSFVHHYGMTPVLISTPRKLTVVDGRSSTHGDVTHYVTFLLDIRGHKEEATAFITTLGKYDIILGKPWFRTHNPHIDWSKNTLCFNSDFCRNNCLPTHYQQLAVSGLVQRRQSYKSTTTNASPPRRTGAAVFATLASQPGVEVFSASLYEIDQRLLKEFNVPTATKTENLPPSVARPYSPRHQETLSEITSMELHLHAIELEDIEDLELHSEEFSQTERQHLSASLYLAGASLEDIRLALETKPVVDPRLKLPEHYHHHLPVFDAAEADKLPPHREGVDHTIELQAGAAPPHGPLYNMSVDELQVLRKFLKENLDKGWIRASSSPAASPVLFAKKPGGGLRFCVDYRALNAITVKNRYPLPLVQETLSRLSKATIYTKLDVIAAFNKIRMKEGDEWLTAFNTRYGLFESLVMPFGLCNAPATFQARINDVLRPYLDIFCTAYIDDVLVYSDNLLEHRQHVNLVLETLAKAGLHLDIKKCEFEVKEVTYLGMIISTEGVRMDPKKVEAIAVWEPPVNVKDVQAFLGFANFYRRFIKGFSRLVTPLVNLTKKDVKWNFDDVCIRAFKALKSAFTSAPTLSHFDSTREIFVETDASDYVSSGILSQKDDAGVLHPVAFMSKKFDSAECNYEIYDKELLAIVRCFEGWRAELQGTAHPIRVLTDHRNLEYFMTTKQLSRRQVRWSEFLAGFDFVIAFRPGKQGGKPDSLTRRSQDLPKDSSDDRIQFLNQALLKEQHLTEIRALDPGLSNDNSTFNKEVLNASPATLDQELETDDVKLSRLLEKYYPTDRLWVATRQEMMKLDGIPKSKELQLSECSIVNERLYFRDRLYVPESLDLDIPIRTWLLQMAHDSVETGHPGKNKLYEVISRDYFWPLLSEDCTRFVRNCNGCSRNTGSKQRYQGVLKPLPIPLRRWSHISVDFMGPFPTKNKSKNNLIMVVVCRLTKERHYTACNSTMKAADLAKLFCRDVWRLHGLPDSIVSDRGSLFVSQFWKAINHRLGINITLSTSFHPETDGQTENANAYLLSYLRQYVEYAQEDWEDWLYSAEFAANNAVNASTGVSPFFANKGQHPRMSFSPPKPLFAPSRTLQMADAEGNNFADKMRELELLLRTNLTSALATQEYHANQHRQPAPAYRVGDEVFLDGRNVASDRPVRKLDHKYYGPYLIAEVVGSHNYKLKLPFEQGLLHPVFHTNLLKPAPDDPLPGQTNPPPPPVSIDADGSLLWAIDAILDSKRDPDFQYLIQWRGYDAADQSWEPLANVVNAHSSVATFKERFPKKLHPTKAEVTRAKTENKKRTKKFTASEDINPPTTNSTPENPATPLAPQTPSTVPPVHTKATPVVLIPKLGTPATRPNTRLRARQEKEAREEVRFVEIDSDDEEIDRG